MKNNQLKTELRKLVIPIIIETLLVMTLGVMDTFMLSQYSDNAVAAVGMVNTMLQLVFLLFAIINTGTSVLCAQYLGAKRWDRQVQVTGVALIMNLIIGIVVSIALFLCAQPLLQVMGLRDELMPYGVSYMQLVGGFAFTQALSNTISATLRSANKANYPMMVIAVCNVVNILGNYALIFGHFGLPALGVQGAAISTSISRTVSMLMLFWILFHRHIPSFPSHLFRPFPFWELRKLLKIGLPSAGENMSYQTQQLVLLYFINMIGNEALATRSYVVNIVMFVYMFAICMAQGGSISIGHLVGKGKTEAAFLMGKYVWHWSVYVSQAFSLVCALCGPYIMGMLTENPVIYSLGCTIFWIDFFLEAGKTINIYATNVLRATGDVFFPFYLGVIVQWGVGVLFGYLFGIHWGWGLAGMWVAFALDEDIRGFIFIRRWNSRKWAKKSFVTK